MKDENEMIKAIIFDLDDTLYDYSGCHEKAMESLKKYCMDRFLLTEQGFRDRYSVSKKIVKQKLGNNASSHNRMLYAQVFLELSGVKPCDNALALYDIYWNTMLKEMKTFDYVIPFFEKLSNVGIKIAVLTDLTVHIQHRKLVKLGLTNYVDVLVTSEEAGCEKPGKQMFDLVLEKLAMQPDQVIMIGDSYEKDIRGAEKEGIRSVLFRKEKAEIIVDECMRMVNDGTKRK